MSAHTIMHSVQDYDIKYLNKADDWCAINRTGNSTAIQVMDLDWIIITHGSLRYVWRLRSIYHSLNPQRRRRAGDTTQSPKEQDS